MTLTEEIVYAVTRNFPIEILGVVVYAAVSYKLSDLWGSLLANYFGFT